jgi:hypothetical protein
VLKNLSGDRPLILKGNYITSNISAGGINFRPFSRELRGNLFA